MIKEGCAAIGRLLEPEAMIEARVALLQYVGDIKRSVGLGDRH